MFKKYAPKECLEAGVDDEKECNDFMFNKYAPQVRCKDIEDWQCKNSIKENHLGNIVSKQAQFKELKENIIQKVGASATVEELRASLESAKEIIPFKDQKINLKIIAAKEDLILDDGDNLIQTGPVAVMIDSDGDGLPDDMEKRFGTDPQKSDSDGDGYSDGDEVKNKYNSLGSGKMEKAISPIDEAIVNNKTLGQPKTEGDESEDLIVRTAANKNDEQGQASEGYVFAGQAEPNSVVTVYVYSDLPLVATAKVDEYGNWQYDLGSSLSEGEHEIYVAVNDNTGKVLSKSKPLNFFVKEAKAVSIKDFIAPAASQTAKKSESSIKYYIIIAILTVVVGILLFVIFHIQRKKHLFKA
ncbi:MAG: Ig-like domain-containing protein [bacterium]|nr:Ig-like domain-containing protein [bacterium]